MKLTQSQLDTNTILKQHRYVMPIHIHRLPDLLMWISIEMCGFVSCNPVNDNIKCVHVFVTVGLLDVISIPYVNSVNIGC